MKSLELVLIIIIFVVALVIVDQMQTPRDRQQTTDSVIHQVEMNPVVMCYTYKDSISCVNVR